MVFNPFQGCVLQFVLIHGLHPWLIVFNPFGVVSVTLPRNAISRIYQSRSFMVERECHISSMMSIQCLIILNLTHVFFTNCVYFYNKLRSG